jgi:hypothetical protein
LLLQPDLDTVFVEFPSLQVDRKDAKADDLLG